MQYLIGPIKGDEQLWVVFWIYYAFISLLIMGLGFWMDWNHLVWPAAFIVSPVMNTLSTLYDIWVNVALWQCAFNGPSRTTGHMIRLGVVLTFCYMLYTGVSYLIAPAGKEGENPASTELLGQDAVEQMKQLNDLIHQIQNP
jgi:hypothetical protein